MLAGLFNNFAAGRRGRVTSSPPQFGQTPAKIFSAHAAQNVHSKEQIKASVASGGRSLSQHSQPGRSSSIGYFPWVTRLLAMDKREQRRCA
jgi:hypothetical protein